MEDREHGRRAPAARPQQEVLTEFGPSDKSTSQSALASARRAKEARATATTAVTMLMMMMSLRQLTCLKIAGDGNFDMKYASSSWLLKVCQIDEDNVVKKSWAW